jgi:hypothetical protein
MHTRLCAIALALAVMLAPAGAGAQDPAPAEPETPQGEDGGIGAYLEGLQREVEETAPVIVDEAREGLGTAERLGRNLYDRWRVCGDSPQSSAPVCVVLTDGEGGPLDPSPGSLDRVFERIQEIAAPYNERSRTAAGLAEDWAASLELADGRYSPDRAVSAVFERIRACEDWPCEVLDRALLRRTVTFLEEHDTEGYAAARRVRTAYDFTDAAASSSE